MDAEDLQAIAARDQFWASLRQLSAQISQLAAGQFDGTERERIIVQLLARCVAAELAFRSEAPP